MSLFAGTGVLRFEAVSRGAAAATLVERSAVAASVLRDGAAMLQATRVRVVEADALAWLAAQPANSMDLVFVDPPFGHGLAARSLEALAAGASAGRSRLRGIAAWRAAAATAAPLGSHSRERARRSPDAADAKNDFKNGPQERARKKRAGSAS